MATVKGYDRATLAATLAATYLIDRVQFQVMLKTLGTSLGAKARARWNASHARKCEAGAVMHVINMRRVHADYYNAHPAARPDPALGF